MKKDKTACVYSLGKLQLTYKDVPNQIPEIESVTFKNQDLSDLIDLTTFSTLLGTKKYPPYKEFVCTDPTLRTLAFEYFDEIAELEKTKPELAVGCADFFFNHICRLYWNLIINVGSKNLAIAFLKKICLIMDEWETKRKNRIHKGTPYYFLTFGFLQGGDIDSAFASMFKAFEEDEKSKDPILGGGAYKTSPAYRYVSLVDDQNNYLYHSIIELRKLLEGYIKTFNSQAKTRFSIKHMDSKFLQNNDINLEQVKYLFTYCLESNRKNLEEITTLPKNDFYKIRNANFFFNLCLITDKILQAKYGQTFRNYVKRGRRKNDVMSMGDGVILLFEDKGWIERLTPEQKKNPRKYSSTSPRLTKNKPEKWIETLFMNPIKFTCNNKPLNYKMRVMQLALNLRNYAGHNIKKQDVFVEKCTEIVEWLLSSIFIAVSALTKPKQKKTKSKPIATITPKPVTTSSTVIITHSNLPTSATPVPPMGTFGFNQKSTGSAENRNENT